MIVSLRSVGFPKGMVTLPTPEPNNILDGKLLKPKNMEFLVKKKKLCQVSYRKRICVCMCVPLVCYRLQHQPLSDIQKK